MEIKNAVESAIAFARESLGPERTANIRLEEIESTTAKGNQVWLITLSTLQAGAGYFTPIRGLVGAGDEAREYKVFEVSKDTGEILSMKIRLLATPTNA